LLVRHGFIDRRTNTMALPIVGLTAKVLGRKAARKVYKGKKKAGAKVSRVKGTKTYAKTKTKESGIRGAVGLKGKGRLNTIRRQVQGPVGYASIGAAAFAGGDE